MNGSSRISTSDHIQVQLSGIRVRRSRVGAFREAVSEPITIEVFYDYQCPFVYRAAGLLDAVQASGERPIEVRWRYFSLTQVNSKDDGWTVWGAPASEKVRGRLAFEAAEAARRQGRFDDFHMPLLDARHRDRLDLDDIRVLERVAGEAGLDLERFRADLDGGRGLDALRRDHLEAVTRHGVFGTPTFVFADGASAYVRLSEAVNGTGAVKLFDRLVSVAAAEPRILEIKRPRRPSLD
ncbi:MAG TPA: DsbA family protein [Candidatus Limnocylindrales bacterium]|nr:DsbA family protein [Candidatus Limnocylindrales bacterium]